MYNEFMKLDRNYNIKVRNADPYSDVFDEVIDLAAKAKEEGKITDEQAALIINIAIKKQSLKELKNFFSSLGDFRKNAEQSEKQTLFIHLKTNRTTYA